MKEKMHLLSNQLDRQNLMENQVSHKVQTLEDEKAMLEGRIHKLEDDIHNVNIARDNLRRDKNTVNFN